jgi:hypothetical protein
MNRKSTNAKEARKVCLFAVAKAFSNAETLTKVELQGLCKDVTIDGNVIGMLTKAGVVKSTRGRNATITMLMTPIHVYTHVDELADKMVRPESYTLCVERHKAAKAQDYKDVIKRLKAENNELSALLSEAWKEIDKLKESNKEMSIKIATIKSIL